MNTKRTILSLFLLLLLIGLVNAQEDFKAVSLPSIELCPCSSQAYSIAVENTGTTASSYKVLADGDAAKWVKFNPSRFALNPGQKGSFSVIVNSMCNIEGDYRLDIFITTNKGITKAIKQFLKFSDCYDYYLEQGNAVDKADKSIKFSQHDDSYLLCKNEQKIIPVLITNNENFGNRYRLLLDAPEWAKLNAGSASLGAKESGIFLISMDTKGIKGEFNFKLNAISGLGQVQRKKNIEVSVGECYALELELEKEKDVVCGGESNSYGIAVKNTGTLGQNVKFEADGIEWAGIGNVSFSFLKPGEEGAAMLEISPGDEVSGSFLVSAYSIIENKTGLKFSDAIELDVIPKLDCYKAEIGAKTSVTNFYNEDFFFVKVKNNGIKRAAYDVSLEGASWVSAEPVTLELNPGQTGNLNLNANPGPDVEPGTYGVKINLESNNAVYSKNINIVLKKENEFVKKLKAAVNFYQYYIYLLILLIVLIILFRKPLNKFGNNAKKRYEKYKIRRERLIALRLARKIREEEKRKKEEIEEKEKKEEAKKEKSKEERKEGAKKFKIHAGKIWAFILILTAALIFIGHQNRMFNAKYLPIYVRNIFVGYLYYILIGIGAVIALFLLVLFYNYLSKKGSRLKAKKSGERAGMAKKRGKPYNSPYSRMLLLIFAGILLYAAAYFNIFEGIGGIKDFLVLYQYYIILGIAMLIAIILLIRFYKPLFKFLRE